MYQQGIPLKKTFDNETKAKFMDKMKKWVQAVESDNGVEARHAFLELRKAVAMMK
jgi:hypothetical protein